MKKRITETQIAGPNIKQEAGQSVKLINWEVGIINSAY